MSQAGREIDSDYELACTLVAAAELARWTGAALHLVQAFTLAPVQTLPVPGYAAPEWTQHYADNFPAARQTVAALDSPSVSSSWSGGGNMLRIMNAAYSHSQARASALIRLAPLRAWARVLDLWCAGWFWDAGAPPDPRTFADVGSRAARFARGLRAILEEETGVDPQVKAFRDLARLYVTMPA